jgi:hypothetical protein
MAMQGITGRKPRTRIVSVKSVSTAIAGVERGYPTYQFSNRTFIERPNHNPFGNIAGDTDEASAFGSGFGTAWGDAWG